MSDLPFLVLWLGWLLDEMGPPEHGWTDDTVRGIVKEAEAQLENIGVASASHSVGVIARTVVYGVMDSFWKAIPRRDSDAR